MYAADAETKTRKEWVSKVEIFKLFTLFFMVIESGFDIVYRKIPAKMTLLFLSCAVLGRLLINENILPVFLEIIAGMVPGGIMLLGGRISRQSIGYGDGVVIVILGVIFGAKEAMEILMYGLLLAAAVAALLMVFGKKSRKTALPFVPFLTIGMGLYFLRKGGIV